MTLVLGHTSSHYLSTQNNNIYRGAVFNPTSLQCTIPKTGPVKTNIIKGMIDSGSFKELEDHLQIVAEDTKLKCELYKFIHTPRLQGGFNPANCMRSIGVLHVKKKNGDIRKTVYIRYVQECFTANKNNWFEACFFLDGDNNLTSRPLYLNSKNSSSLHRIYAHMKTAFPGISNTITRSKVVVVTDLFERSVLLNNRYINYNIRTVPVYSSDYEDRLIAMYGSDVVFTTCGNSSGNKVAKIFGITTDTVTDTDTKNHIHKSKEFEGEFGDGGKVDVKVSNTGDDTSEYKFYGYKIAKIPDSDSECVVKLGILEESLVTKPLNEVSKIRVNRCKVLAIGEIVKIGTDIWYNLSHGVAKSCVHTTDFEYNLGEIVEIDDFDQDMDRVCVPGIHFYINQPLALINYSNCSNFGMIINEEDMTKADFSETGPPSYVEPPEPLNNGVKIEKSKDDFNVEYSDNSDSDEVYDLSILGLPETDAELFNPHAKSLLRLLKNKEDKEVITKKKLTSQSIGLEALDLAI